MAGKLRIYTVAEANALLPQIAALMERQIECVVEIERTVALWKKLVGSTATSAAPDLRPDPSDSAEVEAIKRALREWIEVMRETWSAVESTGAVIKDVRFGVVDFQGQHRGELVWLCWRRGEPEVAFFHDHDQCPGARSPLHEQPSRVGALN